MSAIRRIDRRVARKIHSSPYSRQTAPKKSSSWSISGLLNYFNPLRSKPPVTDDTPQDEPEDVSPVSDGDASTESLGRQIVHDLSVHDRSNVIAGSSVSNTGQPFPPTTSHTGPTVSAPSTPTQLDTQFSLSDSSPSPAKNLETVAAFLTQKAGQPLNEVEAEGLVSLIQKSTQNDDKPEQFRFSSSTPSTPGRGNSPNFDFTTPDSPNGTKSQSPRKTLSKNPNGVYRWEGGGSARPRNRFRSPAFGLSRSASANIKLSPPEVPRTDTKRRRVGEEAETSSSQPVPATSTSGARSSAPSPSRPAEPSLPFPVSNGTSPSPIRTLSPLKVNGVAPRLRLSALPPKPTVPAVPSPLRQAWGQTDSSSLSQSAPSSKLTKAANFMQELIKEVTPPRRPDVSNPYQTASPVKPPTRKPTVKRTRATGKPTVPPQQKEPEPSPQAIIEATVPKGSKRSRPPANLEKSSNGDSSSMSTPRRSPRGQTLELPAVNGTSHVSKTSTNSSPLVEEVSGEDNGRAAKKQKVANGSNWATVTIEEIDDVDMPLSSATTTQPFEVTEPSDSNSTKLPPTNGFVPSNSPGGSSPTGSRPVFSGKSSAPKEPSKLRFSYQPEACSPPSATPTPSPQPPQMVQASQEKGKEMENQVKLEPKDAALAMGVDALPKFPFVFRESSNFAGHSNVASKAAKAVPVSSLPTFDFSMTSKPAGFSGASTEVKAPSATPVAFDWAAAGMKAPSKSGGASWTCSTCMLMNPATAVDKCTVCDTSR